MSEPDVAPLHISKAVVDAFDAGVPLAGIAHLTGMSLEQLHAILRPAGRLPARESKD